jgi:O-antigen/teichoic acid export membrane protein
VSVIARSLKGTLVGSVGFAVQVLIGIVVVPFMLDGWGATQYALWLACQAGFSILLTFDTGHQSYVGNEIAKLLPVDHERTKVILGSGLRFAVVLAAVETALATCLWIVGLSDRLLGVSAQEASHHSLGAVLTTLVASWCFVGSTTGVLARLYAPAGHFARGAWWGIGGRVATTAAAAVAAGLGTSLLHTALCVALVVTAQGIVFYLDARRLFPAMLPFAAQGTLRLGFQNFLRSFALTGSGLVVQLQTSGLILFVSATLGAPAVALFATLRTLANTVCQATATVFSPAVPELVRFDVLGEHDKLRAGLFSLTVLATLPAALGSLLLAGTADWLYAIWTRGKIPFDYALFCVVSAASLWRIFGSPIVNHLTSMNNPRWISLWATTQTGVLVIVVVAASRFLGLFGIGVGLLAAECVGSFVLPGVWLQRRLSADARRKFFHDRAIAALTPITACVALLGSAAVPAPARLYALGVGFAAVLLGFALQAARIPPTLRNSAFTVVRNLVSGR